MRDLLQATASGTAIAGGHVYTVSELNREVAGLLEDEFGELWVEGELSNLAAPASGHIYFSLKDPRCQVRCAMFRSRNRLLRFEPDNGLQVLVRARVGLYQERGDYQLIVEHMEPAGDGRLRLAFEQLKQRLAAEGLFDEDRKRLLPALPRQLGVITSASGAALRDVLSVLKRRYPALPVIVYPTAVQGEGAADQIVAALARANDRNECDVLMVTRGGGSLEDLWPFNEERVARAIVASSRPVIAAVGHEIDFTIADLAADVRAPTPSAGAELVSPDQAELQARFTGFEQRLQRAAAILLEHQRQRLRWLAQRLAHPRRRLQDLAQRLDGLSLRMPAAIGRSLTLHESRIRGLQARLHALNPATTLRALRADLGHLSLRLRGSINDTLAARRTALAGLSATLQAVSPLATLNRGYAIVRRKDDGRLLKTTADVRSGELIEARLAKGTLEAQVLHRNDEAGSEPGLDDDR
jgi:exodeoxyribonuclease VII large subunit